jgi:hypothetical protein
MATITIRELVPLSMDALSGVDISDTIAHYLADSIPGTAVPNACLVLGPQYNIDQVDITTLSIGTQAITSTAGELNLLDGSNANNGVPSVAAILDSNADLNLGGNDLLCDSVTASGAVTASGVLSTTSTLQPYNLIDYQGNSSRQLRGRSDTQALYLTPNVSNVGANIILYPNNAGANTNDMLFRSNADVKLKFDYGSSTWFLRGTSIQGMSSTGTQLGTAISEFRTETNLGANSDSIVPTQRAVKSYVDDRIFYSAYQKTNNVLVNSTNMVEIGSAILNGRSSASNRVSVEYIGDFFNPGQGRLITITLRIGGSDIAVNSFWVPEGFRVSIATKGISTSGASGEWVAWANLNANTGSNALVNGHFIVQEMRV